MRVYNWVFVGPRFLRQYAKKLRKGQRVLSRKIKGTRNCDQARVAKVYERMASLRSNFSHQLTHRLIEYPALCLENLSIIGLTKTKSAKSMLYAAFYQVLEIQVSLEWNYAFEADRFFPSTLCSHCGYQNKNLRLSDREWSCPECKVKHRGDHNAAQNLQSRGYSTTRRYGNPRVTETACGQHIRLATASHVG
jgi:putative transposase